MDKVKDKSNFYMKFTYVGYLHTFQGNVCLFVGSSNDTIQTKERKKNLCLLFMRASVNSCFEKKATKLIKTFNLSLVLFFRLRMAFYMVGLIISLLCIIVIVIVHVYKHVVLVTATNISY